MPTLLKKGITLEWTDVYAYVNPFGDRRGNIFNTVWTFDVDKEVLFLAKPDCVYSAPLKLACQRPLTLSDFQLCDGALPAFERAESLPGPYWNLEMDVSTRQRSFLGRLLTDFAHTWRHVLRRPMNSTTFQKLTYAIIWITTMQFDIYERQALKW